MNCLRLIFFWLLTADFLLLTVGCLLLTADPVYCWRLILSFVDGWFSNCRRLTFYRGRLIFYIWTFSLRNLRLHLEKKRNAQRCRGFDCCSTLCLVQSESWENNNNSCILQIYQNIWCCPGLFSLPKMRSQKKDRRMSKIQTNLLGLYAIGKNSWRNFYFWNVEFPRCLSLKCRFLYFNMEILEITFSTEVDIEHCRWKFIQKYIHYDWNVLLSLYTPVFKL